MPVTSHEKPATIKIKIMRILQILPELNVGGVETGTVDFAKYLVRQGHHSVVVSNGGVLVEELIKSGSKHYPLPVHKKSLITMLRSIRALRDIIREEKIDIVHARSRVPAWIAFFACRGTRSEFLTTCHGFYSNHPMSRIMNWSKLLIVPSQVLGRYLVETFKVPPESIRVVPRSVDLDKFHVFKNESKGKSHFVIGIIGRLTPLKGHAFFLKAMVKVVRSMPYVKIWVIGDAPAGKEGYRQELEILARHLGLSEHVEFLGHRRDIPELLSQMDVLVLSSVQPESFGRAVLEAQASGVPVVATKIGGVLEIIEHEKTGLLVLPEDVEAMGDAVLSLLHDRKFARAMAEEALLRVRRNFTLESMAEKTLAVYRELLESLNILVIKLSSLGDVILITPTLKALRRKFPRAQIVCLIGEESRIVLQSCPYVDQLIVLDVKNKEKGWLALWKFAGKLRRYKFDKIIDLQNNRRSHLLAGLSFPRESYGFDNGKWGFFLTHKIKDAKKSLSPLEHQFQILKMLDMAYPKDDSLELWPLEKSRKDVSQLMEEQWLAHGVNIVGINLSASQRWGTKNWPLEHTARLCDALAAQGIRVIVTGMEQDRETARQLLTMTRTKPENFVGKTDIMQLAVLIKQCRVYITPDSAPMHIAAAMGVPFIALFGPTSSKRHVPPAKNYMVLERNLKCAPCYRATCRVKTHACLHEISPEEVVKNVLQFLK